MELLSIRELKQAASAGTASARFHAQVDKHLQRTTKTGNPFYELTFADAEETLVLRVWNNTPMFAACSELRERQFVEVSGEFGLGNDGRSIDGRSWTARALNDSEVEELLGGSEQLRTRQAADFAFIEEAVSGMNDPRLGQLCGAFLERYGERLRRTAAARDYHHARRGGLVEHVAQMMRAAVKICEAYEMLNRDLLVAGVLFHDVGKLWENVYPKKGFAMPVTEIGELISHIPLGMEIVNRLWRDLLEDEERNRAWRELEPSSEQVRMHLLHLIASHHGEMQFGSPVAPKTPEAQALHYIDNLDAKMEMFARGYEIAGELADGIYERVRPLPGRLVSPLPAFAAAPGTAASNAEAAGAAAPGGETAAPEGGDPAETVSEPADAPEPAEAPAEAEKEESADPF